MRKTAQLLLLFLGLCGVFSREGAMAAPKVKASATPSAVVTMAATPTVAAINSENITEASNKESIYRLESVLESGKEIKWQGWNSISWLVVKAVGQGVPANTVVLLLLLPLVATLVSGLHYIGGVSGYGIFTPTMMAVVFLATGMGGGLALFAVVLVVTLLSNILLRKLKLHYWPARTIALLLVSLGVFGAMSGAAYVGWKGVSGVSIFSVLFMILLTEDFVRTQLVKSKKEAVKLVTGTIILATFGALTMGIREVQEWVLLHAEAIVLLVIVANLLIGNYSGIRLMEIKRFKNAIRKK